MLIKFSEYYCTISNIKISYNIIKIEHVSDINIVTNLNNNNTPDLETCEGKLIIKIIINNTVYLLESPYESNSCSIYIRWVIELKISRMITRNKTISPGCIFSSYRME